MRGRDPKPLPHGRGSDVKSRSLNEAIRATTVREWLLGFVGQAILPAAAFQAALSGYERDGRLKAAQRAPRRQDWLPHSFVMQPWVVWLGRQARRPVLL
jgi:hypothetical protein